MKSTILYALTSAAAFFAVCVSVSAATCAGGGGYRPNPHQSYPPSPSPYSTMNSAPVGPVQPNLQSSVAPAAPQARISVVSPSDAPVGRLQIAAPAASDSKATTSDVSKSEPKTEDAIAKVAPKGEADLNKSLDSPGAAKEETSKIADAIKSLVGPWMAVSRQGDGELSTVELLLNDNGWAKLTVPGADGKPSTTTRKVEFENNELKLTGGDADVLLGTLVEFNSRQMVLERSGLRIGRGCAFRRRRAAPRRGRGRRQVSCAGGRGRCRCRGAWSPCRWSATTRPCAGCPRRRRRRRAGSRSGRSASSPARCCVRRC